MSDRTPVEPELKSSPRPENHLDVVLTPGSADARREAPLGTRLGAVIGMPLFFLVAFTLSYVSATHDPAPRDLSLMVSGSAPALAQTTRAVAASDDGSGFDLERAPDAKSAREAVRDRDADGAIIVDGAKVTVLVASGGGRLASTAVESVGGQVATAVGGVMTVEDVAPLPSDDPGGSTLFFFLVTCTVGAFLSVTAASQAIVRVGLRPLLVTVTVAAVVVPALALAMIRIFVSLGDAGTVASLLGVGILYTLTAGLVATLCQLVLGQASVLAVIVVLVALNFSSSGGSVPAPMLPAFWQALHSVWLGSGALEAMRSIRFFDGSDVWRGLYQLTAWTAGASLVIAVLASRKKRPLEPADADPLPRHVAARPKHALPAPDNVG